MSNFDKCLSDEDKTAFLKAPYLSQGKQPLGGKLIKHPSELESAVQRGVQVYFDKRLRDDFLDTTGKLKATKIPVRRWMAHLLWTTTVNLGCTATSDAESMPSSVVFNDELSVSRRTHSDPK